METKLNVKLLSYTQNPELVIATAGKLCYSPATVEDLMKKQDKESIEKFINKLASMGHESPLEHCVFNFAIEGVSRSLTHQLVRHRIASYSQQSQRYVRESQFEYVIPADIKNNPVLKRKYIEQMEYTQQLYDEIVYDLMLDYLYQPMYKSYLEFQLKRLKIDKNSFYSWTGKMFLGCNILERLEKKYKSLYSVLEKKAIENARYVFPNACETKIMVTMNLRSLINFCRHRCCKRSQDEIRQLAWKIVEEIEKVSPLLARNLGASCQFGKCPEGNMSCMMPYEKR